MRQFREKITIKFRILDFLEKQIKTKFRQKKEKPKIFAKQFPHCKDDLIVLQIYKCLFSKR